MQQAAATRTWELRAIRLLLVFGVLCAAIAVFGVQSAFGVTFDPNRVLSTDNLRHYDSMSEADIQAFLNRNTGPLKKLVTRDHNGRMRTAAHIIWEACTYYRINPKVMLTLLQKEQSLITRTSLAPQTLNRAIGAGCPDAKTNRYPGFGNQIWNGARMLDGYGEGKSTTYVALWKPGMTYSGGGGARVKPGNIATYKLYVYNPSIGAKAPYGDLSAQKNNLSGNASFWYIYRRWFGDPLGRPTWSSVYRFFNKNTGTFMYTASPGERYEGPSRVHNERLKSATAPVGHEDLA